MKHSFISGGDVITLGNGDKYVLFHETVFYYHHPTSNAKQGMEI